MVEIIYILLACIVGLVAGVAIGKVLLQKVYKKEEEDAKERAKLIIREAELQAETLKKDRILEAKEKFLKLKSEFEE